jgi:hypothetical protein
MKTQVVKLENGSRILAVQWDLAAASTERIEIKHIHGECRRVNDVAAPQGLHTRKRFLSITHCVLTA